ncbi:DUF3419 family protein [Hymenobacter lutimineralis]|uniref:DUF3419 family protein n=1 Tax=Hymenobacter lutimineralis TaxID=2606448 RepID=A0A5D6UWY2_9BACT|nr:DUF3419 family protein [Hymenobacter lutimineralis]TYZ07418.1 DUF3419 family protein [Hymenobacter lutimineralis]
MHSEFHHVALDQIRYSVVWESHATLEAALQLQPTDEVLVITSAGCNALNALLSEVRRVTAIDLNPVQNALLEFKVYLIRHFPHAVLRALLGLDGPTAVARTWAYIAPQLPTDLRRYWDAQLAQHPQGLLSAGKLEMYLHGFLPTLPASLQQHVRALLRCATVEAQRAYFAAHLHGTAFQSQFETYFDEANLSRGRDPRLFRYAEESGGAAFYQRLRRQVATEVLADNFFFRFFFFGPEHLPEHILPICYQEKSFTRLRARLPYLQLQSGEAVAYLLSPAGRAITKASLSNIFEYVSPVEFADALRALRTRGKLRLVYWNLLQTQGDPGHGGLPLEASPEPVAPSPNACFYLPDARALELAAASVLATVGGYSAFTSLSAL